MVNHPNRSAGARDGNALAERIMNALAGRAGIRLNGDIVQWDSLKTKGRLCIGERDIPTSALLANLTDHEVAALQNLPSWNGSNEYQISATCLRIVGAAIGRHEGPDNGTGDFEPRIPVAVQREKLARCRCGACQFDDDGD